MAAPWQHHGSTTAAEALPFGLSLPRVRPRVPLWVPLLAAGWVLPGLGATLALLSPFLRLPLFFGRVPSAPSSFYYRSAISRRSKAALSPTDGTWSPAQV